MRNVLTEEYKLMLMDGDEERAYGGLRFGAINGIVTLRSRPRRSVPRKKLEEYVEVARRPRVQGGRAPHTRHAQAPTLEYELAAETNAQGQSRRPWRRPCPS